MSLKTLAGIIMVAGGGVLFASGCGSSTCNDTGSCTSQGGVAGGTGGAAGSIGQPGCTTAPDCSACQGCYAKCACTTGSSSCATACGASGGAGGGNGGTGAAGGGSGGTAGTGGSGAGGACGGANAGTAQPVDPTQAAAVQPILKGLSQTQVVAGSYPVGAEMAGDFQHCQSLETNMLLQPGKCYTVVAAGLPPVSEVNVQFVAVTPLPGMTNPLAVDHDSGSQAVLGKKPNCFKNPAPFAFSVKVVLSVTGGSGLAAAQVYEK